MLSLLILLNLTQPTIPGLEREGLDRRMRGLVLLGELGCAACHDRGNRTILHKTAPDLSRAGSRIRPDALPSLIRDPHGFKPGSTMPRMPMEEGDAEAIAHYLVSIAPAPFRENAVDAEAAKRGDALFHSIGCAACHEPGKRVVTGKYGVTGLAAFLENPLKVRPAGRMPSLGLTGREALDIAHHLVSDSNPSAPFKVDPAKADAGRRLFVERNCVRCHTLGERAPASSFKALKQLDPSKGCLSNAAGAWPSYGLGETQIGDIRAALTAPTFAPSREQILRQSLAALNCIACHPRGDWGGVTKARTSFFGSEDPNLGETGRLPPPLTGTGAKLQPEWMRKTIAYGRRIRPYVKTRMPGFGNGHGTRIAGLLTQLDSVPPVTFEPLPKDRKQARVVRDTGRDLLGSKGMKCIACHPFAGRRSSTMQALDLLDTTSDRLRPEWFYHYMLNPAAFRPGTIMPSYFPGGKSVMKDVLDGDPKGQIRAIWTYLSGGRNQRPPEGLVRPSMEITVADEAVMLRRSAQDTGKRGISVGYPGKVNLTFDAESIAVNQVWHGRFIDAAPTWSGQGSGQVRILGEGRTRLPKGPAFMVLPSIDMPWTTKSSRELGYRFRGYRLDRLQRPTFLYTFGELRISDTPLDVEEDGRPILRRTIVLEGPAVKGLRFRAAVDREVRDQGDGVVHVGRSLEIRTRESLVRKTEKENELLIPVRFEDGKATVVIEYRWREAKK